MAAHRPPQSSSEAPWWHLRFVDPPYSDLDRSEGRGEVEVEPGALAILRMEMSDPRVVLDVVRHALRKSGSCPLVLEVRTPPSLPSLGLDLLELVRRAGMEGVRLVARSPLDRRELRHRLTSPVGLMGTVKQWVQRSHTHLGEDEVALVLRYLAEGANDEDGAGVRLIPERTARGILSRLELPPPVRLRAIGRLLRPILRLQRDPGLTVPSVTAPAGQSVRSFRIAIRRTLGVGVSEVREAWGPEKVLALGFRRGNGSRSNKNWPDSCLWFPGGSL